MTSGSENFTYVNFSPGWRPTSGFPTTFANWSPPFIVGAPAPLFGASTANFSLMLLFNSDSNLPPVILPLGSAVSPMTTAPFALVTETTLNVPEKEPSTSTSPETTSGIGPYLPFTSVCTPLIGSGSVTPGSGGG